MAKAEVVVEGGDVVGAEVDMETTKEDMETTKEDMATTRVDMETTRVDMATTKAGLVTAKAGLVTATKVDLATTIKIMVGTQTGVEEVGEAEVGHIVDLAMIEAEGVGVTFEVGGGWVDEQGAVVSVETRLS